ncbi:hypothetical protein HYPSUDRAFT_210013 [Hypholoma sublateritium FD-334 SS-4]|uniref:Uncharacterized protein n=1 Tax=Hypholoma sublateritium (strain FD-334 SS-4) TaxID=945553 RepID=A0A0D2N811_HYPSF|nr:hypothetical protein HYPSUDRAFT_210013 [Hypholoma sublateritium FD-334 SS-4]
MLLALVCRGAARHCPSSACMWKCWRFWHASRSRAVLVRACAPVRAPVSTFAQRRRTCAFAFPAELLARVHACVRAVFRPETRRRRAGTRTGRTRSLAHLSPPRARSTSPRTRAHIRTRKDPVRAKRGAGNATASLFWTRRLLERIGRETQRA